ncbi:glycoside hydrolase family 88 protein [Paenibacillus sp. S150]|uniref:glycoside hydrolase family 88/105 protein n=1 Tax=Paenibacillus sp. S150 TaxID=2749826 RepID=UPI002814E4B2|nr:glycoside hydrolase family 88 protein [Paenibacillus sp. S150]
MSEGIGAAEGTGASVIGLPAYFPEPDAIAGAAGGRIEPVLAAVAGRYIGANPPQLPVYRVHSLRGFPRLADCRYRMDLGERFPELEDGQFVYVWGKLWSALETEAPFRINCFSPVRVYINGRKVFRSNLNDDVFPDRSAYFRAKLDAGWNHFLLEFVAAGTGCGGIFGTGSVKGAPLHFLAPTAGRSGREGWVYSGPQQDRWTVWPGQRRIDPAGSAAAAGAPGSGPQAAAPDTAARAAAAGTAAAEASLAARCPWYPTSLWSPGEEADGNFSRIFGSVPGATAFAWCRLAPGKGQGEARLRLRCRGTAAIAVYADGALIAARQEAGGGMDLPPLLLPAPGGRDLVVESVCGGEGWGFELEPLPDTAQVRFVQPYPVEGTSDPWLYLGVFTSPNVPEAAGVTVMDSLSGQGEEATFWRVDQPDSRVRPFLESALYGRWNYPLGVTLYGLLRTGEALADPHYTEYAQRHIEQCTALHEYALWDRDCYGAPGINHQLALMDSLDDCGSFGAAMLAAHKLRPLRGAARAAADIAHYITHVQDRQPDGALYRVWGTTDFMQQTMWCDDLYMSIPFLSKYYELTGDAAYLADAAAQFLLYKKRLFQPVPGILHHVYDYKFGKPNGVAWGRGNGWVIFSLAELLGVMPEQHPLRPGLLDFYRGLCRGFLRLQDKHGLWHQVLTDPESYAEASCTSMFIYAFARGVRCGWLTEPGPYASAALKGWQGLTRCCIDKQGNVYGVCRGSGYSFNKLYYKEELTWQFNDTHGTGIVLLAGIELLRLTQEPAGGVSG